MHVALVDPSAQVPYYDHALAGALAAHGHDVSLVTAPNLYYRPGPTASGVSVCTMFGRLTRSPAVSTSLAERPHLRRALRAVGYGPEMAEFVRWIGRARPKLVHLQWSLAPVVDSVAVRRIRGLGCPVVYTAHNVLPHRSRSWHPATYSRLYGSVDRVIVHSRAASDRLCALGIGEERVSIVPMAATEPVRGLSREEARQALDLPADRPLVLFFGQVRPYKGLPVLIDALPLLRESVPDVKLLIAGPIAGKRAGAQLQQAIHDKGLADATTLRLGYVAHGCVDNHFAAADVVALPYVATDDSAVLCTAQSNGRAVVASSVGGMPEALSAGGGLLVPPCDAPALASALAAILLDGARRAEFEQAAARAARSWTWAHSAERTASVYAEVLAGDKGDHSEAMEECS